MLRVVLAQPRGFCAGVERAIEIVERALKKYGPPIYVRHEIVHNRHVVEDLRTRGAVFVDELDEIPPGAMTVFTLYENTARWDFARFGSFLSADARVDLATGFPRARRKAFRPIPDSSASPHRCSIVSHT